MTGYDWPHWHALLNDFPSALLATALFFDLVGFLLGRPAIRQAGFWTLIVGTIGAGLAVISGLQAEERISHGDAVHAVMEQHEQLALITLGVFAVLALWRIFREARMGTGERVANLVATFAGVGLLVTTGMFGGRLVFEHAAGIPSKVLQSELQERGAGHGHSGGGHSHDEATPPAPAQPAGADSAAAANGPSHTHAPGTPAHDH